MTPRRLLPILLLTAGLMGCASTGTRQWVREGVRPGCGAAPGFGAAAEANALSLDTLDWSPFGAPEQGWRTYAPRIAREIGSLCAPDSPAFARRLARWGARHGLVADGRLEPALFQAMKTRWQARRPFLALRARGVCPDPPPRDRLALAAGDESYGGKTVQLRTDALAALRRLRAAARRDLPDLPPDALTVFSGFRSPAYDDERCAREGNCQGVVRAQCSAHRTGLAADLMVGSAPGYSVDASAGPNRVAQSQTPAYRWLTVHARRFGFANYVFEPWHWEWRGR